MSEETYDVIVVGSGAAGAMAALRARDNGMSVLIVEKAHKFGGTSATSGGVMWIPNHKLNSPDDDSREEALVYLYATCPGVQRGAADAALPRKHWGAGAGGRVARLFPRQTRRTLRPFDRVPDIRRTPAWR